jgi:hypothetical protein
MVHCEKHNLTTVHKCSKCTVEKREATMMARYGAKSALQCSSIKEKRENTCLDKFGTKVPSKTKEIKEKTIQTNIKKYGVKHTLQVKEVREKGKKRMMELYEVEFAIQNKDLLKKRIYTTISRFGVESPLQNKEVLSRRRKTNLARYGKEEILKVPEIQEQIRQTMTDMYGAPNPLQCPDIKAKKDNTCEEKYGDKNIMTNAEIFQKVVKNSYKKKEYTLPSGNIISYQGYEDVAFQELLKEIREDEFTNDVKQMPKIMYEYAGKTHRYYPDIYIPSQNRFIEVKSHYTYHRYLEQNKAKERQMLANGYGFEFWICTKKEITEKIICTS